jgi:very-short-patch-repair endonuclease
MLQGKDLRNLSKLLRIKSTPWERKLWYYLRGNRFLDLKFKGQVPMGGYVVDFCCQSKKLVIELDGGHHTESNISYKDLEKQKFLEQLGYKVLRFWNNELDFNIEGVLERIRQAVI